MGSPGPAIVELSDGRRAVAVALLDIDGTANDECAAEARRLQTIGPAREAVRQLEAAGVTTGVATGRSLGEALFYRRRLGGTGPVICEDGAVLATPAGWLREGARRLGRPITRVLSTVDAGAIAAFVTLARRAVARAGAHGAPLPPGLATPFLSSGTAPAEAIAASVGHASIAAAARSMRRLASAYLVGLEGAARREVIRLAEQRGIRCFGEPLHLIGRDADKGGALRALVRHVSGAALAVTGAPVDTVWPIVFGNSDNDLPLFREALALGGGAVVVGKPGGGYWVDTSELPPQVVRSPSPYGDGVLAAVPALLRSLERGSFAGVTARGDQQPSVASAAALGGHAR